jgi:glycosyltransferase involved in cell wall biosynthesis
MFPLFVIVTPSYNLSECLEQTIYSVVGQTGNFGIHYHIQDGGSSDGTPSLLAKWDRLISNADFPKFCREIAFTYAVEPDFGMYDAINRGFSIAQDNQKSFLMGWINADDVLMPGALAAVSAFFEQNPSAQLVGGRTALTNAEGSLTDIFPPRYRSRADLADGLYDGRMNHFIQQEGTFWKSELWNKVGGLNSDLKYAGDFDLWRRFGQHTDYHTMDCIIATHRRREGQLSSNMVAYDAELDRVREETCKPSPSQSEAGFYKFDLIEKKWQFCETVRQPGWRAVSGLGFEEGPFPEYQIGSASVRWIVSYRSEIAVWSDVLGEGNLVIEFRNPFSSQNVEISGRHLVISSTDVSKTISARIPFQAKKGWNNVVIKIETLTPEPGFRRQLGMLIDNARIEAVNPAPRANRAVNTVLWRRLTEVIARSVKA